MDEDLPCGTRLRTWQLLLVVILFAASVSERAHLCADNAAVPQENRERQRRAKLLVVLIGGIDSDPTPAQIDGTAERAEGNSGLYRFASDLTNEEILPEYFNWNGTRAGKIHTKNPPGSRGIADFVRAHVQASPRDRVALVGNSWGGHTALEVARELIEKETPLAVNLAVFLDPSSTGRGPARPKSLPVNVNRAVSYSTRNMFVWGKWDAGQRLEFIDLGDPDNGFIHEGGPTYAAKFDMQAHVAAEWDESIHRDMKDRLLGLVPQDDDVKKIEDGG